MIIDKYTWWRKCLFKAYNLFPPLGRLKALAPRLKVPKYRRKLADRAEELRRAMAGRGRHPLFSHVEIETLNKCNGTCGFCPANRHADTRPFKKMPDELFHSIIDQLREVDFAGWLHLYSNNEPLLDKRIAKIAGYAREALPKARVYVTTNGILLTPEIYRALMPSVTSLTVDNYCTDFVFPPNIEEIIAISRTDPDLERRTRVTMRYAKEILTSRGGLSPNKARILPRTRPYGCLLPTKQAIIRPDGKLSLCCNDVMGQCTMGDLSEAGLVDIWNGEKYVKIREAILASREHMEICRRCDTMND